MKETNKPTILDGCTLIDDANIAPRPEFKSYKWPDDKFATYEEIWQSRDDNRPMVFPDKCPACGKPAVSAKDGQTSWGSVAYACGGKYESKSQIQTHTNKWWGQCGDATTPITVNPSK